MGYTHYWRMDLEAPQGLIDEAVKDCHKIIRAERKVLAGWDGTGKPQATKEKISFNGIGDDSHETFAFPPERLKDSYNDDNKTFDFCKTAYKPYDIVVVACLAAIQDRLGKHILVSSDGNVEDLQDGTDLANDLLGRKVANPLGGE